MSSAGQLRYLYQRLLFLKWKTIGKGRYNSGACNTEEWKGERNGSVVKLQTRLLLDASRQERQLAEAAIVA